MVSRRNSDRYQMVDCINYADNNLESAIQCLNSYISDIAKSNNEIEAYMKTNHAKFF